MEEEHACWLRAVYAHDTVMCTSQLAKGIYSARLRTTTCVGKKLATCSHVQARKTSYVGPRVDARGERHTLYYCMPVQESFTACVCNPLVKVQE